jgi:hypothetical protein
MKTLASMVLLSSVLFAQGQDKGAAKGQEMTLTGCLNKGTDGVAQHYSFTDQKSGKQWTVTGPADLEKHSANHTVRLTGAETAKVFTVTKVEHVAATCDAKAGDSDNTK